MAVDEGLLAEDTLRFALGGGSITNATGSVLGTTQQIDLEDPSLRKYGPSSSFRGSRLFALRADGEVAFAVHQFGRAASWPFGVPARFWVWSDPGQWIGFLKWPHIFTSDGDSVAVVKQTPRAIGYRRKQIVDTRTGLEVARYRGGRIVFVPEADRFVRMLAVAAMYADWRRNLESGD